MLMKTEGPSVFISICYESHRQMFLSDRR